MSAVAEMEPPAIVAEAAELTVPSKSVAPELGRRRASPLLVDYIEVGNERQISLSSRCSRPTLGRNADSVAYAERVGVTCQAEAWYHVKLVGDLERFLCNHHFEEQAEQGWLEAAAASGALVSIRSEYGLINKKASQSSV